MQDNTNLEELTKDILDFYGSDMGTYFDDIAGNEDETYEETLGYLENKDADMIEHFIEDIEESDIDEETANVCGICTSENLISRLKALL